MTAMKKYIELKRTVNIGNYESYSVTFGKEFDLTISDEDAFREVAHVLNRFLEQLNQIFPNARERVTMEKRI